ncbi:hypothetical protein GLOTRDRAFT_95430 [Gloeophyllum trabeum ATCC 11539]|uniref:Uncharacterized protein n=1 Tax=Gloeophyllum trabeum (strain ATCC 11539 / FP-39264 / Madison 617) TaxID=670483 RepID=S7REA9_GLOTA|nr:uncharacterized protein GLOTRDRAFT_95430 [Gloeophyllum trabeum ATCC 11539]EPQ52535.1 hypothetical protein GLOTRDRAFT_95430 [Gloeophyllum trabeum ATCC 11539]
MSVILRNLGRRELVHGMSLVANKTTPRPGERIPNFPGEAIDLRERRGDRRLTVILRGQEVLAESAPEGRPSYLDGALIQFERLQGEHWHGPSISSSPSSAFMNFVQLSEVRKPVSKNVDRVPDAGISGWARPPRTQHHPRAPQRQGYQFRATKGLQEKTSFISGSKIAPLLTTTSLRSLGTCSEAARDSGHNVRGARAVWPAANVLHCGVTVDGTDFPYESAATTDRARPT